MSRLPAPKRRPRLRRTLTGAVLCGTPVGGATPAATLDSTEGPAAAAGAVRTAATTATNVVTPGDFTGLGFDQCLTPPQWQMNKWMQTSPFLAVGVYLAGASRACLNQPNLTSAWVSTQLAQGWKILPITLGPQASCQPRFPRYGTDKTISPKRWKSGVYGQAQAQAKAQAKASVQAAQALGITAGSTLWYDLEGFDSGNTACRESALSFLSAWTTEIHALGYVSGVYSSAGSGIAALDAARTTRPGTYVMPDQIWLARWDGDANTSSTYVRTADWNPGARIKQFQGGHDETWGGVTINIDRDYLDVGKGSTAPAETHCGGTRVNYADYDYLMPPKGGTASDPRMVTALQCLLSEQRAYAGPLNGVYNKALVAGVHAWETKVHQPVQDRWTRKDWMTLLATGVQPALKNGSASTSVRRLQRTLNAYSPKSQLTVDGVFTPTTGAVLRAYQVKVGLPDTGVTSYATWAAFAAAQRN